MVRAVPGKPYLVGGYTLDDLEDILGYIAAEANHTEDSRLQKKLDALYERLASIQKKYDDGAWQEPEVSLGIDMKPDAGYRTASDDMQYDPMHAPDPAVWLALDEQERIALVKAHHRETKIRLPNAELHASIHTIIENQVAGGDERVRQTIDRLMAEGLDRHEALHAVGSVATEFIWRVSKGKAFSSTAYYGRLKKLTASGWFKEAEEPRS